jgi:hypothetical protein
VARRLSRPERERARDRLERFVLRSRKVMAHSLIRDQMDLLQSVADGSFKVKVTKDSETGDREQRFLLELPNEEALESFAARLRPFTIRDERVYWEAVLDAIADLTPQVLLDEVLDIEDLRKVFADITTGKKSAQAYYMMTDSGQLTDMELADLWLNSDALHAQAINSAIGNELGLDERFRAAAGVYARLGAIVSNTLALITHLVREGVLELDQSVFTERVLAETSVDDVMAGGYSAPAGSTSMPTDMSEVTDLDPNWRPIWEEFEEIIEARTAEAEQRERAASPCRHCRGVDGFQFRGPLTAFDSQFDTSQYKQWRQRGPA